MIPRRALLLAAAPLLARCAAAPPPPPVLALVIHAGADQNPDQAGHPNPVAIRIFQLTAADAFRRADIFALADRSAATIGAGFLATEQHILSPGETRSFTIDLRPGTKYIGVIALFRDFDHAAWRLDVPAAAAGTTRLTLATHAITLAIVPN